MICLLHRSYIVDLRERIQPFEVSEYPVEGPPPVSRILQLVLHLSNVLLVCLALYSLVFRTPLRYYYP